MNKITVGRLISWQTATMYTYIFFIVILSERNSLLQKMSFHFLPTVLQVGVLNVVEAPDILYNETSNDTIVAEGASVSLR